MISGSVGSLGKFRLWCDESHVAACEISGATEFDLPCKDSRSNVYESRTLILEVMIPRGARTLYGLLGLRYFPSNIDTMLKIKVANQPLSCTTYQDSLISAFEKTKVGLPVEYANASTAGLRSAFAGNAMIGAGLVEVCYAAFGDVSSNEPIFEKIGFVLAHLLSLRCEDISEDTVSSLLFG